MFTGGGRGGGSNVTSPRMKNRDTAPSSKRSRVSSTGTAEGSGDGEDGGGGGSPSVNGSGSGSAGGRKDDIKVEPASGAKIKGEVG